MGSRWRPCLIRQPISCWAPEYSGKNWIEQEGTPGRPLPATTRLMRTGAGAMQTWCAGRWKGGQSSRPLPRQTGAAGGWPTPKEKRTPGQQLRPVRAARQPGPCPDWRERRRPARRLTGLPAQCRQQALWWCTGSHTSSPSSPAPCRTIRSQSVLSLCGDCHE